jgi:hypothetical protein
VVLLPDEVALISDLSLKEARRTHGRGWDRTSDLPRVKRALSR